MQKMFRIFVITAIVAMAWEGEFNHSYAQPTEPASAPAPADTKWPDDLHLSVGFKAWFNDWMGGGEIFVNNDPKKLDTFGTGLIPTFGLRFKDSFISASGMIGTSYRRPEIPSSAPFPPVVGELKTMHMKRKEVDVNLGHYVLPWLALSAGYKGVFQTFDCNQPGFCNFNDEYALQGPTVGLSLNVPVPLWNEFLAGFSVYGNAGFGYLDVQGDFIRVRPGAPKGEVRNYNHAFYYNGEIGIAYKVPALPIAFTAGYRYQIIEKSFTSRNEQFPLVPAKENDITKGGLIGITFVF